MRAALLVVPALVAFLTGCDQSPMLPGEPLRNAAGKSDDLVSAATMWTLTKLSFTSEAMNNGGVIVGSLGNEAVEWQNGTISYLPHLIGVSGPYKAYAISQKGYIAGMASGHVLVWTSPGVTPRDIPMVPYAMEVDVVGINDNLTVVGNYRDGVFNYKHAWIASSNGAARQLTEGSLQDQNIRVRGMSNSGIVGYGGAVRVPLEWNSAGTTMTILPWILSGSVAKAISGNGIAAGSALTSSCPNTAPPCVSTVLRWAPDGTLVQLNLAPAEPVDAINSSERLAGHELYGERLWTYYNGVTTWFSPPDGYGPEITGIDACGSIAAKSSLVSDVSYLWRASAASSRPFPNCWLAL